MKAIVISPDGAVSVVADSAIGRDVMPLFIPDCCDSWMLDIAPAVRIGRLGKNISERFAMRYVEAVSAVCLLGVADKTHRFYTSGLDCYIDSRITAGQWIDCNPESVCMSMDVTGVHSNLWHAEFDMAEIGVARAISEISRLSTIKSGDLLIFAGLTPPIPASRNDRLQVSIDDSPVLTLKIK